METDVVKVNVSEVQDFMRCRYRWWAKWIMNRVPRITATPLTTGKLIHSVFEDHLKGGSMPDAISTRRKEFVAALEKETDARAIDNGNEALSILDGLTEALVQWTDTYKMDQPVLEVEVPFEWKDPEVWWLTWIGRPDRTSVHQGKVWHNQIKNLAAGVNFAVYLDLQQRSYHEHLYAEALSHKHRDLEYGGTMFTLVRKLKYRTNITKANPEGKVKRLDEMFWQYPMAIDLNSALHKDVMESLRRYAREMNAARNTWNLWRISPLPNETMNGGMFGNSPDDYFRVLTGDASLDDDTLFMDREDTYNKEVHNAEEV